jgi:hypothetical protein
VTALITKLINEYNKSAAPPTRPLPHVRLHDLRYLHATTLLLAGVPIHVVAARLGHRRPRCDVAGLLPRAARARRQRRRHLRSGSGNSRKQAWSLEVINVLGVRAHPSLGAARLSVSHVYAST